MQQKKEKSKQKIGGLMQIWLEWWYVVCELRPACSRTRSFFWLVATLAGLTIRPDLLGVTSIIRALGLRAEYYDRLLDFFHSSAINIDKLAIIWTRLVLRFFPVIPKINGRIILLGDGIKIPKAGKKMPAVKYLHQESENNTKPEYIMGHSCQAVSLVVGAEESAFAVPLSARIHEGLVSQIDANANLPTRWYLSSNLLRRAFCFISLAMLITPVILWLWALSILVVTS